MKNEVSSRCYRKRSIISSYMFDQYLLRHPYPISAGYDQPFSDFKEVPFLTVPSVSK